MNSIENFSVELRFYHYGNANKTCIKLYYMYIVQNTNSLVQQLLSYNTDLFNIYNI